MFAPSPAGEERVRAVPATPRRVGRRCRAGPGRSGRRGSPLRRPRRRVSARMWNALDLAPRGQVRALASGALRGGSPARSSSQAPPRQPRMNTRCRTYPMLPARTTPVPPRGHPSQILRHPQGGPLPPGGRSHLYCPAPGHPAAGGERDSVDNASGPENRESGAGPAHGRRPTPPYLHERSAGTPEPVSRDRRIPALARARISCRNGPPRRCVRPNQPRCRSRPSCGRGSTVSRPGPRGGRGRRRWPRRWRRSGPGRGRSRRSGRSAPCRPSLPGRPAFRRC